MEQRKSQLREPAEAAQVNQLLAGHYKQFLKWGAVLTRGDAGKAEEIVQELCLYFTLTKPDLNDVANLNGYLYTCLRHIYLSGLARSSREALHVISVAEYDSLDFALSASRSGDQLQRQNDLRRICGYAVWRKESSKSASCFILHFFHGYGRREIAELACLPLAGVYNNLKIARAEVKSYLEEPGKLRLVNRELPSEPTLAWSLLPSAEIFNELRETVLHARTSACLSEEELLEHYRSSMPRPISSSLLAHIASCEPCLAVVDRYFGRPTLEDREPLDDFSSSSDSSNGSVVGPTGVNQTMLTSVHRRWGRFHEHRPRTLSIAVDGQIIAFHDVQVRHSKLSARIEYPERARFVEVFSEQDLRLALLPIGELPPEGSYTRTQRVTLSDSRWLELNLTFDGQGLNTQVAYFDPVLVIEGTEALQEESPAALEPKPETPIRAPGVLFWLRALARIRDLATPSSAIAWALTLAVIFGTAGYLAYRHLRVPLDADEILNASVKTEAANLQGQTEHQVLRIEEVSAGGQVLQQGMVDVWKDGDGGRSLRRLFDSHHRVIAARWRNKNGEHNSEWGEGGRDASTERLVMNGFWDQDLSAHGFSLLAGKATQIRAVDGGYELMTAGSNEERPHLISATLVLDRHLHPVREVMRLRDGAEIHELRFVQEVYERRPSASVPDTLFDPVDEQLHSSKGHGLLHQHNLPGAVVRDVQLAELQIAVLYQLNALGADTGEPIEVTRTGDGHIRIAGTLADDALKQKIASQTKMLMNHQLIELRLLSARDVHVPAPSAQRALAADASVYDVRRPRPTADVTVRGYFQARGLSGERLDSAVAQFSLDAVQHAQRALQNAYALERLGSTVSAAELQSISLSSQQQWTEMVDSHVSELEEQLGALDAQLAKILPSREDTPSAGAESLRVENPEQFNRAANKLLRQMQDLNREVGEGLTSNASGESSTGQNDLLERARNAIPLRQVEEITSFASRLNVSAKAASVNR